MELMQLEMFVAMVEEGSFHRAAARVFRTQPAVSMALRRLEQELGAPPLRPVQPQRLCSHKHGRGAFMTTRGA
jgi:DNA-binding transcriptional LysR family regulator